MVSPADRICEGFPLRGEIRGQTLPPKDSETSPLENLSRRLPPFSGQTQYP